MVAIVNKTPKTLGILEMLDAFIAHNKEVVTKRTKFDLDVDLKKIHIIEGFIKALDILDEVDKDTFNWAYKLKTELELK